MGARKRNGIAYWLGYYVLGPAIVVALIFCALVVVVACGRALWELVW